MNNVLNLHLFFPMAIKKCLCICLILLYCNFTEEKGYSFFNNDKREARQYYKKGQSAMKNNLSSQAVKFFSKAYELNPQKISIKAALANALNTYALEEDVDSDWHHVIGLLKSAHILIPDNDTIKMNLAITYHNRAISLIKEDDIEEAQDCILDALDLYPSDTNFRKTYSSIQVLYARAIKDNYISGDNIDEILVEAIQFDNDNIVAYLDLGQFFYEQDNFDKAEYYWNNALKKSPEDYGIGERLEKLRREKENDSNYNSIENFNFIVKYRGRKRQDIAKKALALLQKAYTQIGFALNYYPDKEIYVLIYTDDEYKKVTRVPDWSAGLYDGRIRINLNDSQNSDTLEKRLYHEYTHALLHQITLGNIPCWFNEGLAQYYEPGSKLTDQEIKYLRDLAGKKKLVAWSSMLKSFTSINNYKKVALYYLSSKSIVNFMSKKYGSRVFQFILDEMYNGKTYAEAIRSICYVEIDELEIYWKKALQ